MRRAGEINAEALQAAADAAVPGASTMDLNEAAESVLKKYGVKSPSSALWAYPYRPAPMSAYQRRAGARHLQRRKLAEGDIVSIDCGTIFEGFVADSAITVPVGEVSEQSEKAA